MIWVHPTTRGWAMAGAGLVWFLAAMVNRSMTPLVLACGALAFLAVAFCQSLFAVRAIEVNRGSMGEAAAGQAAALPLIVVNRARYPRETLVLIEKTPFGPEKRHVSVVSGLRPREIREIPRRVLAVRRGEFRLDRITVRGGDPAGLFACDRTLRVPGRLVVFPGIEPLPNLRFGRRALAAPSGNPFGAAGASQEFYGVRAYNPSDGFHYIHWKSSARLGQLMVREFERHAAPSVAVLLDADSRFVAGTGHWSNLEYQIRAAASLCRHAAGRYCRLAVAAGGEAPFLAPPRLAAAAEWDILYHLALLNPGPVPLAEVALRLGEHLPPETLVFCLSLSEDPPLVRALEVLGEAGMAVRWYCATPARFAEDRARAVRTRRTRPEQPSPGGLVPVLLDPGMSLQRVLADVG